MPNPTGLTFFESADGVGGFPISEKVTVESGDGGTSATHTTVVQYQGGEFNQQIVADPRGGIVAGGLFYGTIQFLEDGSFTTLPAPVGVGFQAFDSNGVVTSVRAWNDPRQQEFGGMGLGPSGNVVFGGYTLHDGPAGGVASLFVTKLAR